MDILLPILLSSTFLFGDYDEDVHEQLAEQLAEQEVAFTLQDSFEESWLRILDRTSLPDPDGPMLQRFDGALYRRYHLDINVPDFPMSTETVWAGQRTGVRFWVQSLSEFDLANRWQLRTEIPTWDDGYLAVRYDRRQDRITDQHLLRFDVGHRDIGGSGFDGAIRFHPKAEKNDIDVELLVSRHFRHFGTVGLQFAAVDAFTNASFGLVEARGRQLEEHIRQTNLPLAVAGSFQSATVLGFRGELYGGVIFPQTREHDFRDEPQLDHLRHRHALLGTALIEWDVPVLTLRAGFAMEAVHARMEWEYPDDATLNRSVEETTLARRIYLISQPLETLRFETSATQTGRPQTERGPGGDETTRADGEWLASFRALWMPTEVVGGDFQLLRITRSTTGPPDLDIDGQFNRLVTRLMLRITDDLWTSFGVGWTLDEGTSIYDGGGMTLMWVPRGHNPERWVP